MASAAAPASVSAGWNPASKMNDKNQSVIEIDSNDENDTNNDDIGKEDDSIIDTEQLDEYRDMVERLGSFPDKVAINSLSMVAEDHADSLSSARAVYGVIRKRLLSTSASNMLPLVYVIDSILKNVKGRYVEIIGSDAEQWLPVVHRHLPELQKQKLHKVYNTWVDLRLFPADRLEAMGRCFDQSASATATSSQPTAGGPPGAPAPLAGGLRTVGGGIRRANDGRLLLSATLRRAMEDILDQLQSDMENELDKVSLERLADLNPELLVNIKQTAEENLRTATNPEAGGGGASDPSQSEALPLYFVETRPSEAIERSKAWMEAATTAGQADAVIGRLRELVEQERTTGFDGARLYTQRQAVEMTQILAGALAAATVLQSATDRMKQEEKESAGGNFSLSGLLPARGHGARATGRYSVDKLSFTNRGVTVRDDAVIGMLYEVGLPFLSSVDGRRFASQGELSAHLDALFRRNQLEKAIARTEERGWFVSDAVWALLKKEEDLSASVSLGLGSDAQAATGDALGDRYDPQTTSVPADETRDRCVVCGINFKMVFDNDDGIYKYINCREIEMLNDDAADMESDEVLVHVTCWRGLGSPPAMTADQALHETLHRYS